MHLLYLLACSGCTGGDGIIAEPRPDPVGDDVAVTYPLSVDVPFAELEIPSDNRPEGRQPAEWIPIQGPWELTKKKAKRGLSIYKAPIPIRPRGLFFRKAQPGMEMKDQHGAPIKHKVTLPKGTRAASWTYDRKYLTLELPADRAAPGPGDYLFKYPNATERERTLNHKFSAFAGKPAEEFVRGTTIQDGADSRNGLLLPAPGKVSWDLTIPPAAELRLSPGLVAPETLDGKASDGAVVEIRWSGAEEVIRREGLLEPGFKYLRVDMSKYAGQEGRLTIETKPRDNAQFDYVFLSEPVLGSRRSEARKVVLIFVDTLRPDHLGAYGYERDTSASLDALAKNATVFEQARSVAPWTLPSARTVITGKHPEKFDASPTLQGALREKGWATAMFAGNLYLAPNFGLHRDWGIHKVTLWPSATVQVDRALDWLSDNDGQDSLLLLHFMDAHLPYEEGKYAPHLRNKWAKAAPKALPQEEFHLHQVRRAQRDLGKEGKQYVVDRYDQSIAYVHEELKRLFDSLGPNDVVVYFADHGEEFWDHKGFEHGHTLFDELLHVPLIIKAPGIAGTRVTQPVSLLDVTPTVLDLVGEDSAGYDGTSLVGAMKGESAALTTLDNRDLVFGRPLYGFNRWGVIHGQEKYTIYEAKEALFDLGADPGERQNLFREPSAADRGAPYREYMSNALGAPTQVVYRVANRGTNAPPQTDLIATLKVPGGVKAAWLGDNPTRQSRAQVDVAEDGETVTVTWCAGYRGLREAFILPKAPMVDTTHDIEMYVQEGRSGEMLLVDIPKNRSPVPGADRTSLVKHKIGRRTVKLGFGFAPQLAGGIDGTDDEMMSALVAMGYAVGGGGDEDDDFYSSCQ